MLVPLQKFWIQVVVTENLKIPKLTTHQSGSQPQLLCLILNENF